MTELRIPKPAKRIRRARYIRRGTPPHARVPNKHGDHRARLRYGLSLWAKLVKAKEPSGICPRCFKRRWHDAAHCWTRGAYPALQLELDGGAPLCRPCHRRVDSDHQAKTDFFIAYMGPDKYKRLRLLARSRGKMDLSLTLLFLETEVEQLSRYSAEQRRSAAIAIGNCGPAGGRQG
jgi:hypothetical protein